MDLIRRHNYDPWATSAAGLGLCGVTAKDAASPPPTSLAAQGRLEGEAQYRKPHSRSEALVRHQHMNQTRTTFDGSRSASSGSGGANDGNDTTSVALFRSKANGHSNHNGRSRSGSGSSNSNGGGANRCGLARSSDRRVVALKPGNILFEMLVPIHSKLQDHEEVLRSLGVWVTTNHGGGTNGLSRLVNVRLTDPTDPFFLFEMELPEEDYGAFKQRLELLVDFSGFPKYLVSMLQGIVSGATPYLVSFVVDRDDLSRGTLRVLEKTNFRTVEHVSLNLLRQGDVGQKRYLAERFQHFEQAFRRSEAARQESTVRSETTVADLRCRLNLAEEERDSLSERLKLATSHAQSEQLNVVSRLKEEHTAAIEALRTKMESELQAATLKAEEAQRQATESLRIRDSTIEEVRQKTLSLESTLVGLRSQLRLAEDTVAAQEKEVAQLRSVNNELTTFRQQATRSLSDNQLSYVATAERLRSAEESLRVRETETASLRDQNSKLDGYIRILSEETNALRAKLEEGEASQKKAHHIISKQLEKIKVSKERERMSQQRLSALDRLVDEKNKAVERLRADLSTAAERYETLLHKANDLRDQLSQTDEIRAKLAEELKLSQEALVHLQRNTTVGGRHWGTLASTAPMGSSVGTGGASALHMHGARLGGLSSSLASTAAAYPSFDIYREFSRNAASAADPTLGSTGTLGRNGHSIVQSSDAERGCLEGDANGSGGGHLPEAVSNGSAPHQNTTAPSSSAVAGAPVSSSRSAAAVTRSSSGGASGVSHPSVSNAHTTTGGQKEVHRRQALAMNGKGAADARASESRDVSSLYSLPPSREMPLWGQPGREGLASGTASRATGQLYEHRTNAGGAVPSAYFKSGK